MKNSIKGINRTNLIDLMKKLYTVSCDIGYIMAMLLWIPIIPCVVLIHAITDIITVLQNHQVAEISESSVIDIAYTNY